MLKWMQDNYADLTFLLIIVIVLVWAMFMNQEQTVDKILLVALGMFKGVPLVKKTE